MTRDEYFNLCKNFKETDLLYWLSGLRGRVKSAQDHPLNLPIIWWKDETYIAVPKDTPPTKTPYKFEAYELLDRLVYNGRIHVIVSLDPHNKKIGIAGDWWSTERLHESWLDDHGNKLENPAT